jgi:hypothetical protein
MMKSLITVKKDKPQVFQVLLLDNNETEDVEVEEAEQVDFERVEEHLAHGGSVFITSKRSQKIASLRDKKKPRSKKRMRTVTVFRLNGV